MCSSNFQTEEIKPPDGRYSWSITWRTWNEHASLSLKQNAKQECFKQFWNKEKLKSIYQFGEGRKIDFLEKWNAFVWA